MRVRLHLPAHIESTITALAAESGLSVGEYLSATLQVRRSDEPAPARDDDGLDFLVACLAITFIALGFAAGLLVAALAR